jgi:hypothetical protein
MARRSAVDDVGGRQRFFFLCRDRLVQTIQNRWLALMLIQATATHFGEQVPRTPHCGIASVSGERVEKTSRPLGWSAYWFLATIQHAIRLVARSFARMTRRGKPGETQSKLDEHLVCLRWLITGRQI